MGNCKVRQPSALEQIFIVGSLTVIHLTSQDHRKSAIPPCPSRSLGFICAYSDRARLYNLIQWVATQNAEMWPVDPQVCGCGRLLVSHSLLIVIEGDGGSDVYTHFTNSGTCAPSGLPSCCGMSD